MSLDLDIFIVAYHAKEELSDTLGSIALWTTPGYRLTVYDNADRNYPLTWLWNRFIEQSKRKFIALLNPDIVLSDCWAAEAIACFCEHHDCGVVGFLANHRFYKHHFPSINLEEFTPSEGRSVAEATKRNGLPRFLFSKDFEAAPGHAFVIRRGAWERVGGFDERLPFAGNDYDFNRRVLEVGMKIVVCNHAAVWHKGNRSTKCAKALGTFNKVADMPGFSTPPSGLKFDGL